MRSKRLQNQVTTGRHTLPVVIISCTLCGWITNLLLSPFPSGEMTYPVWEAIYGALPGWLIPIVSFVLFAAIGYFLIEINNRFNIIGIRASVQTSFYFLLATASPWLFALPAGSVAALALLFAVFFLFKSYQQTESSGNLFHAFVSLGVGSIFFPQLTLLAPFWWIGAYRLHSLHPRSFCATLVGWSLPYWLLFGHAFFWGQMELFYQPFIELATFHPIHFFDLPSWELATLGYLFVLFIVGSIHCFTSSYLDKIRTRAYLSFLIILGLALFTFILLQPIHSRDLLPSLLIVVSILSAHFFGLTSSRGTNILFIMAMSTLLLLYIYNVWMLF